MKTSRSKEIGAERLERLRKIIRDSKIARVDDLCVDLKVSPATVRRDLELLEKHGEIHRVHGGAVSVEGRLEEPLFDDKTLLAAQEKQHIARVAFERINSGDTLYLDGGSTVLLLARLLKERTDITLATNSMRALLEHGGSGPRLIFIGGELRRRSQTMVGPLTRFMIEQLHFDKAFMGTMGLTPDEGLTTTDPAEGYTKELVMQHSREVFILADHSKIGKVSFANSGSIQNLTLITDELADSAMLKKLRKQGMDMVIV